MAKFLKYKWAENGTIDAVPNLLDPSGFVSYQEGYGADYSRILGADPLAKPVERKKLNGVLNDLTGILQLYQVHGVPDFISTTANGGTAFAYDINAMVRYTDGKVYINALAGNTNLPTGTGWNIVPNNIANKLGDATQIFKVADAINADEALSKGQLLTEIKEVDGPGSGIDADTVDGVQGALLGIGGAGYSWVDETANRSFSTTYTNTTGKPIMVQISQSSAGSDHDITISIDGVGLIRNGSNVNQGVVFSTSFIVPAGSTYVATPLSSVPYLTHWSELK